MLDRFPEAFRRFERRVDVDRIQSFEQLTLAFRVWAGRQWRGTWKQREALRIEADRLGIPAIIERFRVEARPSYTSWFRVEHYKGKTVYRNLITGRFIRKP